MPYDDKNLLDPRHPRSPYNKYNYDSPISVINPNSPHYDPEAAEINAVMPVVMVFVVPVYLAFLTVLLFVLMSDSSWVRPDPGNPNMLSFPAVFGCFVLAFIGSWVTRSVCCKMTTTIIKKK